MRYKFLSHTADVKFRAYGKNLNIAFGNSAVAMFKAMYPRRVECKVSKKIKVNGNDLESLLYNFLEELLVLLDSNGFFLSKTSVKIDEEKISLEAELFGDMASNYEISLQVKAVTFNEMVIKKTKDKYLCQVVLDV